MFILAGTFEDIRFNAKSDTGHQWTASFCDGLTGEQRVVEMTALQLSYVVQMNLHLDGEPEGFEKMYESLEPLFVGWPNHLRPIP